MLRRCNDDKLRKLVLLDFEKLIVVNQDVPNFFWMPLERIPEPWKRETRMVMCQRQGEKDDSEKAENEAHAQNNGGAKQQYRRKPKILHCPIVDRVDTKVTKVFMKNKKKRRHKRIRRQDIASDDEKKKQETNFQTEEERVQAEKDSRLIFLTSEEVKFLASECQKIQAEISAIRGAVFPHYLLPSRNALVLPEFLEASPTCRAALSKLLEIEGKWVSKRQAKECVLLLLELLTTVEACNESTELEKQGFPCRQP